MGKTIGIDLGTTNSCMAVLEDGVPTVISNAEGGRTTPSVVAVLREGNLVGLQARRLVVTDPQAVIISVQEMFEHLAKPLDSEAEADYRDFLKDSTGLILRKLKVDAESYLGESVTDAVIAVPVSFDDAQRDTTRDAGGIAGLEVQRIVDKRVAAATAYGLDRANAARTILVFDLGGTFDVSVLELRDGVFEVKAANSVYDLGGESFDREVVDWMVRELYIRDQSISLHEDWSEGRRPSVAAEQARIELSSTMTTQIDLPDLTPKPQGRERFQLTLTRAKLEELTQFLIDQTVDPTRQALADAGLDASEIDHVVLVGGITRMPAVQAKVREIVGKEPEQGLNPDEVVAIGAAMWNDAPARESRSAARDTEPRGASPVRAEGPGTIFVSYAREDRESVMHVVDGLRHLGRTLWLDDALVGGQAWWETILARIRECSVLVQAISPAAARSEACNRERRYAVALGKPILPVLIEQTPQVTLASDLAPLQYVDYTDATSEARAFKLAAALAGLPAAPTLPWPLPDPPELPMTPLVAIGEKLRAPTLTLEDQWAILGRLRAIALNEDAESEEREGAVSLLRAMRAREDLYYRVFEDIGRALEDVSGGAPDTGSTAAPEPSPPDEPVFSSPREEMLELVKDGLANHLGIDGGSITEDMSWQELGADSLDLVELVMDAEDQLGIKIGDGEVQGLTTVGEAVDYLVAKTST